MEQVQWSTPNKSENNINNSHNSNSPIKSPVAGSLHLHRTPKNQNEFKHKQTAYQNSTGGFTVLPNHITPPSGFTKFIARNPFEANLTNRLHLSVISPTVFSKVSSPMQDSPRFGWSVEELALIKPVLIEESPIQQLQCSDPEVEIKAQAAINKFFCENRIVPSPWDSKRKDVKKKIEISTPTRPQEDLNSTRDSHKSKKKDSSAQTVLSLPSILPKELEEALKPYFTFTQEQCIVENDEANLSNSSLRRKLFFNQDDSPEDENYSSSMSLSPVRSHGDIDLGVNYSPTQSGMFLEGFSMKKIPQERVQRNHGTPMASSGNLSPPTMSPIGNSNNSDMSCQSIKSRVSRSVARLDFTTDMSIEASITEEKKTDDDNYGADDSVFSCRSTLGTSMLQTELNSSTEDLDKLIGFKKYRNTTKQNETVEMILLGDEITPVKCKDRIIDESGSVAVTDDPHHRDNNIVNRLKLAAEWCKLHSNESCCINQNNTFAGGISSSATGQQSSQSISYNFAQDTGYQTYSMNSTSINENLINVTPTKRIIKFADERNLLLSNDDDLHVSDWRKNLINIYSSTPSKKNRDVKDNN